MFHAAARRLCEQVVATKVTTLSCTRSRACFHVPVGIRRRASRPHCRRGCEEEEEVEGLRAVVGGPDGVDIDLRHDGAEQAPVPERRAPAG